MESIWVPNSIYMHLGREKHRKHTATSFRVRNFLIMGKSPEFIIKGHLLGELGIEYIRPAEGQTQ